MILTTAVLSFCGVADALSAAQACRAFSGAVEAWALWSRDRLSQLRGALLDEGKAVPRRRGPSKISTMKDRPSLCNFVTGELSLRSLARVLAVARLASGQVFADLGCGAGRQLLGAALLVPGLRKVVGYELLDGYLEVARRTLQEEKLGDAKAELRHADFTADGTEWPSEADVVLAVATCFDDNQMARLQAQTTSLRPGAMLVSIDKPIPTLRLVAKARVEGDWGPATAFVHEQQHT
ncbi:hypothetical protein CTAYLR_007350 [Chrysophaeum taylorii]|uniref:Histone-lysine N-methyltransferase, H3 lysine-79 specific n=1 Tax=Chrysophaeum taylorii TaxID=2483200 RepID=A0AAD7UHV6_9STRA|nr:hypothetical protein CTAYLR_007350 [Chrysophaeum taylorii]